MDLTVLAGVCLTCALSGVFPWISAEVAVVGAAAFLPPDTLPLLVAGGAAGQVMGKSGVYALARWAPQRLPRCATGLLVRLERYRLHRRRLLPVTAVSAACGLPPFYLVTLACGTLGLPVGGFIGAALCGTALRYSILAWGVAALSAAFSRCAPPSWRFFALHERPAARPPGSGSSTRSPRRWSRVANEAARGMIPSWRRCGRCSPSTTRPKHGRGS